MAGRTRIMFKGLRLALGFAITASFVQNANAKTVSSAMSSAQTVDPAANANTSANTSANTKETIRVRLKSEKSPLSITGTELQFSGQGRKTDFTNYRAIQVAWTMDPQSPTQEWTVTDRDTGRVLAQVLTPTFSIAGHDLRINLNKSPDHLVLAPTHASRGARTDIIASVDLESYVRGVLPSEMPPSWPLEALKAQAIAARTFALYRRAIQLKAHAPYDVASDVSDQVYKTPMSEGTESKLTSVEQAIRETTGVILKDQHGSPLAAYFHADCGGHTEEAQAVWGHGANLGTAVDSGCPMNPIANWSISLKPQMLADQVRVHLALPHQLALLDVQSIGHTPSGRVDRVRLTWDDGTTNELQAHLFRSIVGYDHLKSTQFQISKGPTGDYVFTGRGYGHGVGLCQWGARGLAQQGRTYRQILAHYYPKALISDQSKQAKIKSSQVQL
jgi:stage II sporulation protein D